MSKAKGFDRLRLLAVVATATGLFAGVARSARAGGSTTVTAGGAAWAVQNSLSGPQIAPFTGCTFSTSDRARVPKSPNGNSSSGCAMNIVDGALSQTRSDAFDGFFLLALNGTQYQDPDGNFVVGTNTVNGDVATIAGLSVSAEYYFSSTQPVARVIYALANTTGAPITVLAQLGYNLGSDSTTLIQATSDGDLTIEPNDAWHVTSEGTGQGGGVNTPEGGPDPIITLARFGTGGTSTVTTSPVVFTTGTDDQIDNYSVTVPAGQTRRLMVLARMSTDIATGLSTAPTFNSLTTLNAAGLLAGLTPQQQAEIVNWAPLGNGSTSFVANVPAIGGLGKLALLLSVGGIGAVLLARRARRDKA